MLQRSTIQLLRFHFSFFLLPVYLFALNQVPAIAPWRSALVFFILHLLVYPSSNGYNSYMDRDTESIGGLASPLQPTRQLFHVTLFMDIAAVVFSLLVSRYFAAAILLYILVSRAYSYRGIRLKKYPLAGYLTVVLFQGAFTFCMVYHGCDREQGLQVPWLPALVSSALIGGFYPLTQIYQYEADRRDGVTTISYLLGYRGTFIFCGILYTLAMALMFINYSITRQTHQFLVFIIFMLPVPYFFFRWAAEVWKNTGMADFKHAMSMNVLASVVTNMGFLAILIMKLFE